MLGSMAARVGSIVIRSLLVNLLHVGSDAYSTTNYKYCKEYSLENGSRDFFWEGKV